MSVIPKINVGLPKRRSKMSLDFDNSTTANIGNIQPTMCREMVPGEKFSVNVSSLVRLASMPLPTFGRISLRHNHVFVPYNELWQPFDAMLANQHYAGANTFVPSKVPYFTMQALIKHIIAYSDITIYPKNNLTQPLLIDKAYHPVMNDDDVVIGKSLNMVGSTQFVGSMNNQKDILQTAVNYLRIRSILNNTTSGLFPFGEGSLKQDDYGVIRCGDFYIQLPLTTGTQGDGQDVTLDFDFYANHPNSGDPYYHEGNVKYDPSGYYVDRESADLITAVGDYMLCFKFKAPLKRLRTIFIGLGYTFSPYSRNTQFSILKLLAYYKGWFTLFRPNRQLAFVDTNCYKLIKKLSESDGNNVGNTATTLLKDFIDDLIRDCYYYLPMDYFSMATTSPQQPVTDNPFRISTNLNLTKKQEVINSSNDPNSSVVPTPNVYPQTQVSGMDSWTTVSNPLILKLAQRLLTFANKNTVIGRSIREYLKVHYGVVDVNDIDAEGVIRIGSSRVNIQISDVMSTAENSQGYLGEYGGKGIGFDKSESFDYTTDKFGCWITFTVVVPESGYFQGYLRENRHIDRYEHFMPEFDCLGYQVLERGEIMDSYDCDNNATTGSGSDAPEWNPADGFDRTAAFGLIPRYSEYKVGRNIVNGDLSLVGLKNSMSPYTLDRRIPSAFYTEPVLNASPMVEVWDTTSDPDVKTPIKWESDTQGVTILRPDFIPSVVYDDFRRIDPTDHLGQYNRIFNYGENDLDHFIIHNIFNVTAVAPMKSLSNSFDTYGEEDDSSIEVSHS